MLLHSIQHGPSQAIYAAIKLVEEAQDEVLLSTFVLEGQGHAGKCLINAIMKSKAKSIKLLTNHYTLFSQKTLDYLSLFPCISDKLEIRVWKHRSMNSNHAKFVIADSLECALGGYNFQEAFFMDEEYAWNDLGITIASKYMAKNLAQYFYILWNQSEIIECDVSLKNDYQCPINSKGRTLNIEKQIDEYDILTQIPKYLFLHSHKSRAFKSILNCFDLASNSIDILSPNVIDTCIWDLLMKKLSLGIKIRILTNEGHNSSQSFLSMFKAEADFFCSKKRKFLSNLDIRYSNIKNAKPIHLETDGRNWPVCIDHSKYFCVDLKHFYIGSFNMDTISMHACGETGVIIYNQDKLVSKINSFLFDYLFVKAIPIKC